MEAMSGMDLSEVRVHRNSGKPAQLSALAYAQGNEIHLGPGQEEFDDDKRQEREARESKEAQASALRDKQERAVQRSVSEQKAATVKALTAKLESSHEELYATIKLKHVGLLPVIGRKRGQISAEDAKRFSFSVLGAWISSLPATNARIIEKYERFDAGHQAEFEVWVSANSETISDLIT